MNPSIVSTVLRALLKWWWLIVVSVALGVGVGFLVHEEQPDIYSSTATVLVGQNALAGNFEGANRTLLDAFVAFLRRATILEPVIEDLGLNTSVAGLNSRMTIIIDRQASLIEISIYDSDPDRAAIIANRVAQELIERSSGIQSGRDQEFIRTQLADIEAQITNLQERYNQLLREASAITSAFELNQNLQEQAAIQTSMQSLRELYSSLGWMIGEQQQVVMFEAAAANYWPVVTNTSTDIVLAGVAGLVLSVASIVAITFFDNRIQWSDTSGEIIMGLRVLGPLGIIPNNKLPLYVATMPGSLEVEALRQLRAKMLLAAGDADLRVITITSYDSGDGKTVTSANFALSFAKSGVSTLIIDGDMRKGDLNEVFKLPNVLGLSDVLASNDPIESVLDRAILDSGHEHLSLLTCGRTNEDPVALLSRPRFTEMVNLLTRHFEIVIFDSVPTIGGPDAAFMGEVSDGVVIITNARRTTYTGLERTIANLRQAHDINILGVVLNRVRLQVTNRYSHKYYRSTPAISPERLERELAQNGRRGRHVVRDAQGVRLYSVQASATQLGVSEKTVREWMKSGYLKPVRRGLAGKWVPEGEIERVLAQLPTGGVIGRDDYEESNGDAVVALAGGTPAQQLIEQRAALLNSARKPDTDHNQS